MAKKIYPKEAGQNEVRPDMHKNTFDLSDVFSFLDITPPSEELTRSVNRLYDDVWAFLDTGVPEMCRRFGISQTDAVALSLCSAIPNYINSIQPDTETEDVLTAAKIYFKQLLAAKRVEEVWIRCFDRKNKILLTEKIAEGNVGEVFVSPRSIVERAMAVNAGRIIIVHNHPMADAMPSVADFSFTSFCYDMLKRWNVNLLDHFIVGMDDFYSFADNGKIEAPSAQTIASPKKKKIVRGI